MNHHRKHHYHIYILAINAILFLILSQVSANIKADIEKDVQESDAIIQDEISLRNDNRTSGWFEWLFPSESSEQLTSGSMKNNQNPAVKSPSWISKIFGSRSKIDGSGDDLNITTTIATNVSTDTPTQELKVCEMFNGTMGYCQPMKRCVMASPDEMHFTICHDEPNNLLCCPKVTEPNEVLIEKYQIYLSETMKKPEYAKGLPINPDGHCGMTTFERKISATRRNALWKEQTFKNERVVQGRNAQPGEVAWMVSIYYKNTFICGGSIVSNHHILTAAHCVYIKQHHPSRFSIRYGSITVQNGTQIRVKEISVHPDYNPPIIYHDIAILKLKTPIEFSDSVQPICLPGKGMLGDNMVNKTSVVAGYGDMSFGGSSATTLQLVKLEILENSYCEKNYRKLLDAKTKFVQGIRKNLICAGFKEGGRDACQGDSGGPLWTKYFGANYLIGIVSFGYKCAQARFPGVYTAVANYLDFISENMNL